MKMWRRFVTAWRLSRRGELIYVTSYQRRSVAPMPGNFDGTVVVNPGDMIYVYLVKS